MADHTLTVPEAAFVTGHSVRGVNDEIDSGIVASRGRPTRRIGRTDLLYLAAIRDLRTHLGRVLRQRLRDTIAAAHAAKQRTARIGHLTIGLDAVEADIADRLRMLDRLRGEAIEERLDILGGEPVLRGTRIPARHVAEMARQGASTAELGQEFDLSPQQVEAAILYDQVSPRSGRPPRKARRVVPAPR
ncbi:DUF433 domain-containing protein [Methylobacterium sp. J-070]|uniref:DUF433 domain-containing protein n=1 Tax=Methylobacterium sp. J-070 TaxID=2836650 RepID=UPI001FBA58E9|nr:DUF433 domain-containing protein [Methylobacterium sp. J-070]MCJ2053636.1 DUF433 domain-containing protein [Methylobacterium sp. J-070]